VSAPGPVARALRGAVRTYQAARAGRPSPCRFTPSCSAYAVEALEVHGAARGSWLAVRRLSRCRPLGGRGWDPVPLAAAPPVPSPEAAPSERPASSSLVDRTA
jgi:putative membrane protein insertion efficiency factor